MKRPHVLWLTPFPPSPPYDGGRQRMHAILSGLSQDVRLTVLTYVFNPLDAFDCQDIENRGVRMRCVLRRPTPPPAEERLPGMTHPFYSRAMIEALNESLREDRPDIIQVEFFQMAPIALTARGSTPIIYTEIDASHLSTRSSYLPVTGGRESHEEMERRLTLERRMLARARCTVALSRPDAARLRRLDPLAEIVTIPMGIRCDDWADCHDGHGNELGNRGRSHDQSLAQTGGENGRRSDGKSRGRGYDRNGCGSRGENGGWAGGESGWERVDGDRRTRGSDGQLRDQGGRVLFVGSYPHYPNEEAAVALAKRIMPAVWRRRPGARLVLAGSHPTPAVMSLAGPRVTVTGTLEDLRPEFRSAEVFAAPIKLGSGMKAKILQAFAAGVPVVARPEALKGLPVRDGRDVLIGNTDGAVARALVRLMGDPGLRRRLSLAGRRLARRFDWSLAVDAHRKLYERCARPMAGAEKMRCQPIYRARP